MTLYEIDRQLTDLIDPDTGEIADFDAFDKLTMERETKIENLALWYINTLSDVKAIKEEEKRLGEKRKKLENRAESLKGYIDIIQAGEAFKTARVTVSYRKGEKVDIADEDKFLVMCLDKHDDLLRYGDPTIDRTKVKDFLKGGGELEGASIKTTNNIQIK